MDVENFTIFEGAKEESPEVEAEDSLLGESQETGYGRSGKREIKKSAFALLGAALIFGMLAFRILSREEGEGEGGDDGSLIVVLCAWVSPLLFVFTHGLLTFAGFHVTFVQSWAIILILTKISLSLRSNLSPNVHVFYASLDFHIFPWVFIYTLLSFFDFRTNLLELSGYSPSLWSGPVVTGAGIFATSSFLFLLEGLAPRYSFSDPPPRTTNVKSPPPPELNASLFSLATFAYLDPLLLGAAFPSASRPPLSPKTVPDLPPEDKIARVLYNFRRDTSSNRPRQCLFWSLIWHFRWSLVAQQGWAYVNTSVFVLPSLLLQEILNFIDRRGKGLEAPLHVGLLLVLGIAFFQFVSTVASKQADLVGARISLRIK